MVTTRLGIVGYGWVARDYLAPAAVAHPEVALVAAVSPNAHDLAELPEGCTGYASLDAMLRDASVDAVYIATPNHLHAEQTIRCAAAGLDILCEKPLARSPREGRQMAEAVNAAKIFCATAFDQRYHPAHQLMQQWVGEGKLGTLTQLRLDYACWLPAGWSADNWRIDPERAGGGAIIDLAPHGLDLMELISGQQIEQLHVFEQRAVQDYTVDDGGALSMQFDGGALGVQTVAYNRRETLPRRRLEVIGTKGMLLATDTMGQDPGGRLVFTDAADGSQHEIRFDQQVSPFYRQLDAFHRNRHTRQGRTINEDLRLVELLHRAQHQTTPSWP